MRKFIMGVIFSMALFVGSAASQEQEPQIDNGTGPAGFQPSLGFGIGVGIPFGGGIGGNVEAILSQHFSASLGLGIAGGELGWAGGVRVYPIGRDNTVSPRLSAYYGTVAILDFGDHKELDRGPAYGVGLSWRNQPNTSVEFDLLYVDYEPPAGFVDEEDGGDINLMLGYGWRY